MVGPIDLILSINFIGKFDANRPRQTISPMLLDHDNVGEIAECRLHSIAIAMHIQTPTSPIQDFRISQNTVVLFLKDHQIG